MNPFLDDVTIIIRSTGERTEALCRELIRDQGVAGDQIFIIRESPFSQALVRSYTIGLAEKRRWTFCVDADLLLRPNCVQQMVALAEQQDGRVCEVQGYILDKFFGGPRSGGVHLYRTVHLDKALKLIPEEGVDIRPEHHTLEAMKNDGYPWVSIKYLCGLHDFEQYYKDIFRKCFVQAHKHLELAGIFLPIWRDGAPNDVDFQVALHGFAAGLAHFDDVYIDSRQSVYELAFSKLPVEEKGDMPAQTFSLQRVEEIISGWQEPEIYLKSYPDKMGLHPRSTQPSKGLKRTVKAALRRMIYKLDRV